MEEENNHSKSPSDSPERKRLKPIIIPTQPCTSPDTEDPKTPTKVSQSPIPMNSSPIERCNISAGCSSFVKLVKCNSFVDKTMLIKELVGDHTPTMLITCPRRFGKTTNMNMIKTFLEIEVDENGRPKTLENRDNYKFFTDTSEGKKLQISKEQKLIQEHLGQYPVISISFKDVKDTDFDTVSNKIKSEISRAFRDHEYIYKAMLKECIESHFYQGDTINKLGIDKQKILVLENVIRREKIVLDDDTLCFQNIYKKKVSQEDFENSLKLLSRLLYDYFDKKKVYVLIDEYDTPVNYALQQNSNSIEEINSLIDKILGSVLKDNDTYLEKGLMTGISVVAKNSGSSGLNNVQLHSFLASPKYSKYYGFTDEEVTALLNSPTLIEGLIDKVEQQDNQTLDYLDTKVIALKEQVKNYYNGYLTINDLKIYNPWSIMNCLQLGKIQSYWTDTGCITHINGLFKLGVIKSRFEDLIRNGVISLTFSGRPSIDDVKSLQKLLHVAQEQIEEAHINLFFAYIFELGYLTPIESSNRSSTPTFYKIPNQEILQAFSKYTMDYYVTTYKIDEQDFNNATIRLNDIIQYNEQQPIDALLLLESEESKKTKALLSQFETSLNTLLKNLNFSTVQSDDASVYTNESLLHTIVAIIAIQSQANKFASEAWVNTGMDRGRMDIMAIYKTLGIIIEVKYGKTAEVALQQIVDKKYNEFFLHCKHIENILDLGINLNKDKEIQIKQKLSNNKKIYGQMGDQKFC